MADLIDFEFSPAITGPVAITASTEVAFKIIPIPSDAAIDSIVVSSSDTTAAVAELNGDTLTISAGLYGNAVIDVGTGATLFKIITVNVVPVFTSGIEFNEVYFRTMVPAFADATQYPTAILNAYWNQAALIIRRDSLGLLDCETLPFAIVLCAAHMLTLAQMARAGRGQAARQVGFVASATVDKVSVAALAPPVSSMFDWWLSGTPFGQELAALLEIAAVAGFHVGGIPERLGYRKGGGGFW